MGKLLFILFIFTNLGYTYQWLTPSEGQVNHQKALDLYMNLFDKYIEQTQDTDEAKKLNKLFLKEIFDIYRCQLTTKQVSALKLKFYEHQHNNDPLICTQLAFLLIAHKPDEESARIALKLMNKASKLRTNHKYGDFLDFLIQKYKSFAIFHLSHSKNAKAWKESAKDYIDAYVKFAGFNSLKNFDHYYAWELRLLLGWNTSKHHKYAVDKLKNNLKNPWLGKLAEAIHLSRTRSVDKKIILKTVKDAHFLNPKSPLASSMTFILEPNKDERDKWLNISKSIVADYVKSYENYISQYSGNRIDLILKTFSENPELNALHENGLKHFAGSLHFDKKHYPEKMAQYFSAYNSTVHSVAKRLEARIAQGQNGTSSYSNNVHTLHYKIAKDLKNYSHIRKIHELYGDVIDVDINNENKYLPYCYAITGNAGKIVKDIEKHFRNLLKVDLSIENKKEWIGLLRDIEFARTSTNNPITDGYFNFVKLNCQTALSFLNGEKTNLVFDKDFSLFYRYQRGTFKRKGQNSVELQTSMQHTHYLKTLLRFPPPYSMGARLKILSKSPKAIIGIGSGYLNKGSYNGRMFVVNKAWKVGFGRPATYDGEFRDFRKSIVMQKFEKSGPIDLNVNIKVWNGAATFIGDGKLIETYIDKSFVPGAISFGTPAWFSIGGHNEFSNVFIQKIDDEKPTKGYTPKYKIHKLKK